MDLAGLIIYVRLREGRGGREHLVERWWTHSGEQLMLDACVAISSTLGTKELFVVPSLNLTVFWSCHWNINIWTGDFDIVVRKATDSCCVEVKP